MQLGKLAPSLTPGGETTGWITFRDAKHQIRTIISGTDLVPTGCFRPRSLNRGELSIPVDGGLVTASRKVGAPVMFVEVITKTVDEMTPEEIEKIIAGG